MYEKNVTDMLSFVTWGKLEIRFLKWLRTSYMRHLLAYSANVRMNSFLVFESSDGFDYGLHCMWKTFTSRNPCLYNLY